MNSPSTSWSRRARTFAAVAFAVASVGWSTVTLRGWSRPFGAADHTEGGYALTAVDSDFWDAWLAKNLESSFIVDKIILGPHKDAASQARGNDGVEQMFKPISEGAVPGVTKEERAA